MPNATYSPFPSSREAAIAGFDRPDDLLFVRIRQADGTWEETFLGYPEQVKEKMKGFIGTYRLHDRTGLAVSPLIQIV